MKAKKVLSVLVAVGVLGISSARAATLRAMSLADLTRAAHAIFIGTVIDSESAWNAERTRIYTRTTFQVDEYLKGSESTTLVVETLGGVVEGAGMMVSGMPWFRQGDKHLIFVAFGPRSGTARVLGWAQGSFRVQRDPQTGRETLSRGLAGVSLSGRTTDPLLSIRDLDRMKAAVRDLQER